MTKSKMQKVLKDATNKALHAIENGEPGALPVFIPPVINGKAPRVIQQIKAGEAIDIKANLLRIQADVDPIGNLMAVAAGIPVPTYRINEAGQVDVIFETLPLKDRMQYHKFLAERIVPKMSIAYHKESPDDTKDPHSWGAIVEGAAEKADESGGS